MNAQSSISVATSNNTVWIRVEGKGSFQNSSGLKEFAKEMIQRGNREFVVDLKNCVMMDSTFMGTLAGMALKLRELGQGELRVVNLNERNADLLCGLGLDQILSMDAGEAKEPLTTESLKPADDAGSGEKQKQTQAMLEAHEALVKANPENIAKFKDVLEFLKQDLHAPSND